MNKNQKMIVELVIQPLIAAIYIALLAAFQFMSFAEIQFRIAEILLILVIFSPKHAIGILVGTFLGNLILSPYGIVDAAFGTLASAVAIGIMLPLRKIPPLALIGPVVANALIVPIYVIWVWISPELAVISFSPFNFSLAMFSTSLYWAFAGWVALGQFSVLYLLGLPVYFFLRKHEYINELLIGNYEHLNSVDKTD